MPFWIISGAQRSPHTSNDQLWYHFGFNRVDQIHPNTFESVKIQPDPPTFGSAFSRLCEHMAQLSIRKSHPFGTAFPFERLSYGRNGLPFVNTFQSKRGSIRNGFGITPRDPVGPSPLRYPWAPWGSLGSPWVHPKGSAPCGSDVKASREFGGGAALPERGYWVGGMRVSVFVFHELRIQCLSLIHI